MYFEKLRLRDFVNSMDDFLVLNVDEWYVEWYSLLKFFENNIDFGVYVKILWCKFLYWLVVYRLVILFKILVVRDLFIIDFSLWWFFVIRFK